MAAISVITPTKNRCPLLAETIESVRSQTFPDWEHWIIDDGSDDGTEEMVRELAAREPRVKYLKRLGDRPGGNVCRNIGIHESRTEFIAFLDSDDLLASECLERRVTLMRRNLDVDFAVFQTGFFVDKIGDRRQQTPQEIYGDDLLRFLYFELPWIITGPIWRRKQLERLGGFDESLPSWQDVDLHLRAICAGMRYLRFPVIDHNVRWRFEETKVSVLQRSSPKHLEAAERILEKFERVVREGPGFDWRRQRALCGLYFTVAECWVDVGQLPAAFRCWRRILTRGLASSGFHYFGSLLLRARVLPGLRASVSRVIQKWKGWVGFRSNPEPYPVRLS